MEYFALFNLLILLLFFLSKKLTNEIYSFLYFFTRRENIATNVLAFIFFPGVLLHELSHFIVAKFLLVPTGKMILLPKREGSNVKLGSVFIQRSNIVNEFFISTAPLFIGITIILGIVYFLVATSSEFSLINSLISAYAIFVISNTMYASKKDLEFALPFLVILVTIGVVLFVIDIRIPAITLNSLPSLEITRILTIGSIYLLVPIVIDLIVIILFRIMSRVW